MRKHSDQQQQLDFFVAYLTDLPLRDRRDTMERPFFSLSKRRTTPIDYTSPDGRMRPSNPSTKIPWLSEKMVSTQQ